MNGKTEENMLEDGKKVSSMVKELIILVLERLEKEFGIMGRELGLINNLSLFVYLC